MKSVLTGFLGTYVSRYSDFEGYWLHGQLPFSMPEYEFDLIAQASADHTAEAFAWRLANRRFAEQLMKASMTIDAVKEARLRIRRNIEIISGWHGIHRGDGYMVQFEAFANLVNGHSYRKQRELFVAPHDPGKENRRLPSDWCI